MRARPFQMESSFHGNMRKGKAIILSLRESEKTKLYNVLNVYEKELFSRVENYCYSTGEYNDKGKRS